MNVSCICVSDHFLALFIHIVGASQVALVVKNLSANAGDRRDAGSISGLGRSPEEGTETHSNVLAWRISWTEEPGGCSLWGHRVGHD